MKFKLIFDTKNSNREKDANGFLHVKNCHCTKVQIAQYLGCEISKDLIADKVYNVFRPEEELKKANTVQSLNGVPLQLEHHDDTAEKPAQYTRIGATGTDAVFEYPYLSNSLHFFNQKAIDLIESGEKCELSIGYDCEIHKEAGEFEGVPYDFVQRNIKIQHVALVECGRAGADVKVSDSKEIILNSEKTEVKQMDKEKLLQLINELVKVGASEEEIKAKIDELTADACEDDEVEVETEEVKTEEPDTEEVEEQEQEASDEEQTEQADDDDLIIEEVKAELEKAGLDAENEELVKAFIVGNHFAKAETEATDEDTTDEEATEEKKEAEEQKATDTALKVAKIVKADIERRFNAVNEVRHVLGDVNAMKYDSADKIYRDALAKMGVNVKSLKDSECRAVFRAVSAVKVKSKDCNIKRAEKHTALDKLFNRVSVL
ncbi:MAG: DUF2213 domain-containing protein [Succinivibrio dextrinosolvens]|nr:DUF2213 domain-containing protein [Succinivibrio dextrinosolvens]